EDVCMIELEIVQYCSARTVMHELGALIEERGVVFVGLDHEKLIPGMPRGHRKIHRHAADQEPGSAAGALQDPGEHCRYRSFALRARHRQHMAPGEDVLGEPLWARNVALTAVEDRFHQGITAR